MMFKDILMGMVLQTLSNAILSHYKLIELNADHQYIACIIFISLYTLLSVREYFDRPE